MSYDPEYFNRLLKLSVNPDFDPPIQVHTLATRNIELTVRVNSVSSIRTVQEFARALERFTMKVGNTKTALDRLTDAINAMSNAESMPPGTALEYMQVMLAESRKTWEPQPTRVIDPEGFIMNEPVYFPPVEHEPYDYLNDWRNKYGQTCNFYEDSLESISERIEQIKSATQDLEYKKDYYYREWVEPGPRNDPKSTRMLQQYKSNPPQFRPQPIRGKGRYYRKG